MVICSCYWKTLVRAMRPTGRRSPAFLARVDIPLVEPNFTVVGHFGASGWIGNFGVIGRCRRIYRCVIFAGVSSLAGTAGLLTVMVMLSVAVRPSAPVVVSVKVASLAVGRNDGIGMRAVHALHQRAVQCRLQREGFCPFVTRQLYDLAFRLLLPSSA